VNGVAGLAVLNYGRQAFEQIEKGSLEKLGPLYSAAIIKKALFTSSADLSKTIK